MFASYDGKITNNSTEMPCHAVDFYSCLYKADKCNSSCAAELYQDLPKIDSGSKTALKAEIYFQEHCWTVQILSLPWH